MTRILVVGAAGYLGRRLFAQLGRDAVATYHRRPVGGAILFDATCMRIRDALRTAGCQSQDSADSYGSIDMEGCAADPAATAVVNVVSTIRLISDLLELGIKPVFVSTDYIFDGTRSLWTEEDVPRPRMAYGAQKLAVELWLATRPEPWLVTRLSKLVSGERDQPSQLGQWVTDIIGGKPQNCADDQYYSPAFVDDIAAAIVALAEAGASGTYHVAGPERFSRFEFLSLLAREVEGARGPAACRPSTAASFTTCRLSRSGRSTHRSRR